MEKRIRPIKLSDAQAVRDIYAPFVSDNATSFEVEPPDAKAMEQRILDLGAQYPWLVFEVDGQVLGYAYASSHRSRRAYQWCVEVSVYIHDAARRFGVGRALYLALFEILRRQGYVNAYAGITLPNPASIGMHQSLGFVPIGIFPKIGFKFGEWHDVAWLELRLSDAAVPIPDPLPVSGLLADAQIAEFLHRQAQTVRYGVASKPQTET